MQAITAAVITAKKNSDTALPSTPLSMPDDCAEEVLPDEPEPPLDAMASWNWKTAGPAEVESSVTVSPPFVITRYTVPVRSLGTVTLPPVTGAVTGDRPVKKTAVIPSARPSKAIVMVSPGLTPVAGVTESVGNALTGRAGLDSGHDVMKAAARE